MSKLNKDNLEKKLERYIKKGKLENAVKTANRLSKMSPNEARYTFIKADCLESLGRYDESVDAYRDLLKISNNEDDYCLIYGKLDRSGRAEDALDIIEEGLNLYPGNELLTLDKAKVLVKLDRFDDAIQYINSFSNTDDYWRSLQFIKVDIKKEFEDYIEAIKICDEILNKEMSIDTLNKKIEVLFEFDLIDEAEELVNSLIDNEEYKEWAISNKACIYDEIGKKDEAYSLIEEFIKENPESKRIKWTKSLLLMDDGKYEEAEELLDSYFDNHSGSDFGLNIGEDGSNDENEDNSFLSSEGRKNILIARTFHMNDHIDHALELLESFSEDSKDYLFAQLTKNMILHEISERNFFEEYEEDDEFFKYNENIVNSLMGEGNELFGNDDEEINFNEEDFGDFFANDPRMHLERGEFRGNLSEAEKLIEDAWAEANPKKRKKLAKQAIKLDKYAIDAYNILAYNTDSPISKMENFKKAIDMFNKSHDEEYFEDVMGHFWGFVETRPFMRAMEGFAQGLNFMGEEEEAADTYQYMLELNPGDNQGVRFSLINILLSLNRLDDASELFNQFEDDGSAHFIFGKLLHGIKLKLDKKSIEKLYLEAIETNKHVVPFLLGKKRLPTTPPQFYSPGDSSEAFEYISLGFDAWDKDESALEILEYLDLKFRNKT